MGGWVHLSDANTLVLTLMSGHIVGSCWKVAADRFSPTFPVLYGTNRDELSSKRIFKAVK